MTMGTVGDSGGHGRGTQGAAPSYTNTGSELKTTLTTKVRTIPSDFVGATR